VKEVLKPLNSTRWQPYSRYQTSPIHIVSLLMLLAGDAMRPLLISQSASTYT